MMRFEIECSEPHLDFCVCVIYHTSQKTGKENTLLQETKKNFWSLQEGLQPVMFLQRGPVKSVQ